MVVVIGPLSGGHTHKTADRPIIPSSLTPPLNIVHRIFSLDRLPAVLLLPASKAARPFSVAQHVGHLDSHGKTISSSASSLGWRPSGVCSDPVHLSRGMCLSTNRRPQSHDPLAASSVRSRVTSARLRLHLRLHQSLQYLGGPSGSLTSSCIPYTALDLDAPRPSSNVPGAARVTRYRTPSRRPLVGLHCAATRPDSSRLLAPLWRLLPGEVVFSCCPAGSVLRARRRAWQKDRSVRSQCCARPSPAYLNIHPRLLASLCHSGTVPSKCPMYLIFMRSSHLPLLL